MEKDMKQRRDKAKVLIKSPLCAHSNENYILEYVEIKCQLDAT